MKKVRIRDSSKARDVACVQVRGPAAVFFCVSLSTTCVLIREAFAPGLGSGSGKTPDLQTLHFLRSVAGGFILLKAVS